MLFKNRMLLDDNVCIVPSPRMKEYFIYLAENRRLDNLYKKAEGKLEVSLYRNYSGG